MTLFDICSTQVIQVKKGLCVKSEVNVVRGVYLYIWLLSVIGHKLTNWMTKFWENTCQQQTYLPRFIGDIRHLCLELASCKDTNEWIGFWLRLPITYFQLCYLYL